MNSLFENKLGVGEGGEDILCNDCTIIALNSDRLAFVK